MTLQTLDLFRGMGEEASSLLNPPYVKDLWSLPGHTCRNGRLETTAGVPLKDVGTNRAGAFCSALQTNSPVRNQFCKEYLKLLIQEIRVEGKMLGCAAGTLMLQMPCKKRLWVSLSDCPEPAVYGSPAPTRNETPAEDVLEKKSRAPHLNYQALHVPSSGTFPDQSVSS